VSVLLLRADADGTIGTGHAMRCLALGRAWIALGGRAVWATIDPPPGIAARYAEAGIARADLPAAADPAEAGRALVAVARDCAARAVMLDGAAFGEAEEAALACTGLVVAAMDDEAMRSRFAAHLIVNPNLHADPAAYAACAPGAKRLCGPDYAMLRPEFAGPHPPRVIDGPAQSLLVALGGADTTRMTERLAAELVAQGVTRRLRVTVVVGAANPRAAAVRAALAGQGELVVDVREMRPLMAAADLALTSGGSAVWEMACTGLPTLIGATVPVEQRVGEAAAAAGAARWLGWFEVVGPAQAVAAVDRLADDTWALASLSARAQRLVDGRGAERVAEAIADLIDGRRDRLQPCSRPRRRLWA